MTTDTRAQAIFRSDYFFAALFFALFVAVVVFGTEDAPLLADNQHYFFIAERAAAGVPPHISQFDPKNALGTLVTAGAMLAGRSFGIDDVTASRIVSVAAGALAIALIWPLARRITGSRTASWVAVVGMLSLQRFIFMSAMGSQPKIFLVALLEASMLAMSIGRPAWAGATAAGAFLCWQPAIVLLVTGPIALLLARGAVRRRDSIRRAAVFVLAAVVPIVAYEAYFIYHDALADQIEQAFVFPARYMESLPRTLDPILRRASWTFAVSHGIEEGSIVPLAFVVALVVVWLAILRRDPRVKESLSGRPDRLYFFITAHIALASCLVSFQGYPDRFWLDPLMATGAGWLFALAADWFSVRAAAIPWHAGVRAACVGALVWMAVDGQWNFRGLDGLGAQRNAAAALGEILDSGYSVYAVGCTHLLAMNHRDNFSPYGFFFRGVDDYLYAQTQGRGFRPRKDGAPPDVILVSRGKYIQKQRWFVRDYVHVKREEFTSQMIQVYLRGELFTGDVNRGSREREAPSPLPE